MLAVSSSFHVQKSAMFQDFDGGKATVLIPLYTDEEWRLIVNDYREQGVFPSVDYLGDSKLRELTGRVPRLLATVKQRYVEANRSWTDKDYVELKKSNRDYFAARVKAVMNRNKSEKDVLEFSCRVCINDLQSVRHAPPIWIDSGLFENGVDGSAIPIAPDVIGAMYDTISTNIDIVIQTLAKTDARGYAFQMFVQMGLEKQNTLSFPIARLNERANVYEEGSLTIDMIISKRIEQIRPLADSMIPTHEDNSMIICYSPNHPVADVVVYSGGYINFISISVSSYSVHPTKFEDLFTLTVGETGLTVFSYYCLAAPKSYNAAMIAKSQN